MTSNTKRNRADDSLSFSLRVYFLSFSLLLIVVAFCSRCSRNDWKEEEKNAERREEKRKEKRFIQLCTDEIKSRDLNEGKLMMVNENVGCSLTASAAAVAETSHTQCGCRRTDCSLDYFPFTFSPLFSSLSFYRFYVIILIFPWVFVSNST